jgi:hypothetical protein
VGLNSFREDLQRHYPCYNSVKGHVSGLDCGIFEGDPEAKCTELPDEDVAALSRGGQEESVGGCELRVLGEGGQWLLLLSYDDKKKAGHY